jgi:hypothetical protein
MSDILAKLAKAAGDVHLQDVLLVVCIVRQCQSLNGTRLGS